MERRLTRATAVAIAVGHDVTMAAVSFLVSLYLRLGDNLFQVPTAFVVLNTVLFTLCAAIVFRVMGLYRGIWRYASMNDLIAITKAVSLAILVYLPLSFLTTRGDNLPRSLLLIDWLALMALLGGPRFLYRLFKDGRLDLIRKNELPRVPVLLVGAGDGSEVFVRAMDRADGQYRVVGILSDDPHRVGYRIHGVEVMGSIDDLAKIVQELDDDGNRPQRLVLTHDDFRGDRVRKLFDAAEAMGLALSRMPRLTDFKHGKQIDSRALTVQPIAIEDLLNRPQAVLDREGMKRLISGRRVVVTGAGGSIGSELVRQIADCGPSRLVLVDNSEFHLYEIDMEMSVKYPELSRVPVLADIRDRGRIDALFAAELPELVFHAAALKHVPMVEYNPVEGVHTNVLGTRNVADACREFKVAAMVMISTDKAVNPTNVMGATKRAAESYCQALDVVEAPKADGTRYITVRFGNVLGSTGSVVPLFQKQLAKGGPLTVTHPDITRYFMTIREAVELVLQAAVLRVEGREPGGRLYVLDMGEPVKIVDLAKQMIRLAGLRPNEDVQISFTGLRPGEKLFEELFHDAESLVPTSVKSIRLAAPRAADHAILSRALDHLAEVVRKQDADAVLGRLQALVPEFAEARARKSKAEQQVAGGA